MRERSEMLKLQKAAMLLRSAMTPAASRLSGGAWRLPQAGREGQGGHAIAPRNEGGDASALAMTGAGSPLGELSLAGDAADSAPATPRGALAGGASSAGLAKPATLREEQEAAVGWNPHLVRRGAFADEPPPDPADEAAMRRELGFPVPGSVLRVKNLGERLLLPCASLPLV